MVQRFTPSLYFISQERKGAAARGALARRRADTVTTTADFGSDSGFGASVSAPPRLSFQDAGFVELSALVAPSPQNMASTGIEREIREIVNKFVSCLMKNGNQPVAKKILYDACMFIKMRDGTKTSCSHMGIKFLYQAVHNARPLIECSQKASGSAGRSFRRRNIKPIPITSHRANRLAIKWIIEGASKRPEKTMALRLSIALMDAYQGKGYAIKKREETHLRCKANLAVAA
uniref:30S ribosomal protein S7 n=1 Tax=Marophrys sp. SRT127 TaxID=2488311 RepID=A0A455RFI7_9EUKA|nr:30S ribosomal protein S7 [Marophrys sp. SRT127]